MLCGALGIGPAQLMRLPRGRVRSMGAASRPIRSMPQLAGLAVNGVLHARKDLFLKIKKRGVQL